MAKQAKRYAGYDGRAADVDSDVPASLMPWVSDNWTKLFTWRGDGKISGEERAKLHAFVASAHKHGRLVRFWAHAGEAGLMGRTAGRRCRSDQHRPTSRAAEVSDRRQVHPAVTDSIAVSFYVSLHFRLAKHVSREMK